MPILEVSNLTKIFRDRKKEIKAIDDLSLTVNRGDIVGLLGPNGAGKTTTIKCTLGLMRPTAGTIRVNGHDPHVNPGKALESVAAVLEGSRNIYWRMSAWENIVFFAGIHGISVKQGKSYFDHLIEVFKLTDKRDTEVRLMSQGMKQKVAIACVLAKRTPLIFLDEPTLGLDVETSYELRETLKHLVSSEERTVVVSSHDMGVIQDLCQRVVIMSGGRLIADEQMDDLLSLFRNRSYEIVVAGMVDTDLLKQLQNSNGDVALENSEHRTVMRVNLPSARHLYDVVQILREHNAELESITQDQPDLEKAFLAMLRKERDRCNDISQH